MKQRCEPHLSKRDSHTLVQKAARSYYAEVAADAINAQIARIEQIVDLAFGDLGARHLEVRVFDERRCRVVQCANG